MWDVLLLAGAIAGVASAILGLYKGVVWSIEKYITWRDNRKTMKILNDVYDPETQGIRTVLVDENGNKI